MPELIRTRVTEIPRYTFINYATAGTLKLQQKSQMIIVRHFPDGKRWKEITISLTKPNRNFFAAESQTDNITPEKMWTITTTVANNKTRFVTLITPLNKFGHRTASGYSSFQWMRAGNEVISMKAINNTKQATTR